jgi:prepilin-type N-terminal cleavage/methylation domain-containing protein
LRKEEGFTFIEVLVTTVIFAVLLTLGASAFRHFWLERSLSDSAAELVSQLRQVQEQAVSETHPLVYGLRLKVAPSYSDESNLYSILSYNPDAAIGTTCRERGTRRFESGVFVTDAEFTEPSWIGECPGSSGLDNHFVFFYARGSATPGELTLEHTALDRTESVTVTAVTGRVANP